MTHNYVSLAERKRLKEQQALIASVSPKGSGAKKKPAAVPSFRQPTAAQTYVPTRQPRPRMLHTQDCFHAGEGNHVPASPDQLATLPGCQSCS